MSRDDRRAAALAAAGACACGIALAVVLHWPALTSYAIYKSDITQAPHWAAYHTSAFRPDDLILDYASFNESPLQNAIYWIATWLADYVTLTKVLAVVSYGALAAFCLLLGRAMYGLRFGVLLAAFVTFFPGQWEFSAGFFSKFWAIPLLLTCVFLLDTERYRGLAALLPLAAMAYPTAAVLIGMIGGVCWLLACARRSERARALFRALAIGSALALGLLALKYVWTPEGIGPMRPGAELREMPELQIYGYPSRYIPIPPLHVELRYYLASPFVIAATAIYALVLRRRVGWEWSWLALLVASAVGYVLAAQLFMRLYIPDRYTRYSLAVALALWHARNWDLILDRVRSRAARWALLTAGFAAAGYALPLPREALADARESAAVCRFIRQDLPEGILVAGAPAALDDVMVQARRSVLTPYKLAHPWFVEYYDEIRERTRATLRAHFAADAQALNELHRRWGATHFLVDRELLGKAARGERVFPRPYSDEVSRELKRRRTFYLSAAPPGGFLFEDGRYALLALPVPD